MTLCDREVWMESDLVSIKPSVKEAVYWDRRAWMALRFLIYVPENMVMSLTENEEGWRFGACVCV